MQEDKESVRSRRTRVSVPCHARWRDEHGQDDESAEEFFARHGRADVAQKRMLPISRDRKVENDDTVMEFHSALWNCRPCRMRKKSMSAAEQKRLQSERTMSPTRMKARSQR